ncbi:MAG: DJ-1/PfpI family protein [Opitutales bacterium]
MNIAILIFDEVEVLDFAGPFEVFSLGSRMHGDPWKVFTVGPLPGTILARGGLKLVPDHTLESCPPPDVLVVPGGFGTRALLTQPALLEWIRFKARKAKLVLSVCTGALVLAKVGLLDGLTVTTHHSSLDRLAALAPTAKIDASVRFHDNPGTKLRPRIVTAAGISAGIDGALHVASILAGPGVAAATAHQMEYFPGR